MKTRFLLTGFIASVLVLCMPGCSYSGYFTKPIGLALTPYSRVQRYLGPGERIDFKAVVANDAANAGVRWTLTPEGCGSLTNQSATAASFVAPTTSLHESCTATITETSLTDPSKSFTTTVVLPAIQVAFTPREDPGLMMGTSLEIKAATLNDTGKGGVTWRLNSKDCGKLSKTTAAVATFTAPAALLENCTASIIATSISDPSKSNVLTVSVFPKNPREVLPLLDTPMVRGVEHRDGTY